MPTRSRASSIRRRLASQIANANIPRSLVTHCGPQASYAASITSVSDVRSEPVAERLKLDPQLPVVVDLTVVGDPRGAVLGRHRLRAALEVDDGQSPMSQRYRPVDVESLTVRAPMCQAVSHLPQQPTIDSYVVATKDPGDPAHA